MIKFFKILFFIILFSGVTYYCIDTIQYKYNLMDIEDYEPISTLRVDKNLITKSKYPFIDVHNHQFDMPIKDLSKLVIEMDSMNMGFMVNLSGFRGIYLEKSLKNIKDNYPERFGLFVNIDFEKIDDPDFGINNQRLIRDAVDNGVIGLKIYKSLGLNDKDKNGNRIKINDPRLKPVWDICAEMNIPVLIHSGEPSSFWDPKDKNNERWLELKQKPGRYRDPKLNPSFEEVLSEQHDMFRKNPNTIFINAHLGWMGNDLDRLSSHLDNLPNVMTEIGAVLAEIGRQPKRARKFFIDYQDRILFGKDSYKVSEYYTYFRVLETDDEYFDYYRKRHGNWKIYGINLPDIVLKKIYYQNALNLFPGLKKNKIFNEFNE
ncbi:MAG: amidohydrolase family protein [Cytophagales bacterium]|nr:amidohydrolase family protein [Cytophagales bacterium]